MLRSVLIAFLLLGSDLLKAQYEAILNDPDVIWAAEIELTFWIEPEFTATDSVDSQRNYSTLLKLANQAFIPGDESQILLATRLFKLLSDEQKQVFAHPDSLRPLTMQERNRILNTTDTVSVFDPETYMESNKVVVNSWSPESIQQLRVRQLLFYRDKTDEFEVYTAAFAPILKRFYGNTTSEMFYRYTPYWFKMPPYRRKDSTRELLNNPDITWARRMRTGTNMPDLNQLHPFKDFKQPIMQSYLNRLQKDPNFKVREGLEWQVVSQEARTAYLTKKDSVITFDPETYEEKLQVIDNSITGEDIMKLRLVEDWFWDERRKILQIQLYAFAPMATKYDNEANFMFNVPVFWRLVKD